MTAERKLVVRIVIQASIPDREHTYSGDDCRVADWDAGKKETDSAAEVFRAAPRNSGLQDSEPVAAVTKVR